MEKPTNLDDLLNLPAEMLANIVGKLDYKGLAACRATCTRLRDVSCTFFINSVYEYKLPLGSWKSAEKTIAKYWEYLQHEGPSFPNICLQIDFDEELGERVCQRLLNDYGHTISILTLHHTHAFHDGYNVNNRDIAHILLRQCPLLNKFTISGSGLKINQYTDLLTSPERINIYQHQTTISDLTINAATPVRLAVTPGQFWRDMFLICPKMTTLNLFHCDPNTDNSVATQINELFQTNRWDQLSILSLLVTTKRTHVQLMHDMKENGHRIHLKKFHFHHLEPSTTFDFCKFLDCQAMTLETLIVDNFEYNGTPNIQVYNFPRHLPKLKYLNITLKLISTKKKTTWFPIVEVSEAFPSLLYLHLPFNAKETNVDAFLYGNVLNTLKTLELPSMLTQQQISEFAELYPKVEKLIVSYQEDSVIQLVWTLWPNLKFLVLCVKPIGRFTDSNYNQPQKLGKWDTLLTGFSFDHGWIKSKAPKGLMINVGLPCHNPSIRNLTHLQKLFIIGESYLESKGQPSHYNTDSLTDFSIIYALKEMKSLKTLQLWRPLFSSSAMAMLKEGNPELKIDIQK